MVSYHIFTSSFLNIHLDLETYNHSDHGWSISSSSFILTHWSGTSLRPWQGRQRLGDVDCGRRHCILRSPSCDFFKKHQETDVSRRVYISLKTSSSKNMGKKPWIQTCSTCWTFTVPSSTKVPIRAARCKGVFPKKSWPLICVPIGGNGWKVRGMMILLMEAILHHLGCIYKTL